MSTRFYNRRSTPSSLFGQAGRTEPDMRAEFNQFLDGNWQEIAKKQRAILRKMRRDSSDNLTLCPCVDDLTGEPDRDTFCPVCHGERWIWDESWIDLYSVELGSDVGKAIREVVIKPGLMNVPLVVFFVRSSASITNEDKIVKVVRDKEGVPVEPYKRSELYRISAKIDLRADGGKLEYWKLDCYTEKCKFLNGING